jgi:hypothetical protein
MISQRRVRQVGLPLSRRSLLRCATGATAAAAAALLGPQPVSPSPSSRPGLLTGVGPPTFYLSAMGNDSADGLTPDTAWATIQKANSSLPADGSIVLFRRGEIFYGELNLPFRCEVGAFGTGVKPILTMFKLLNRSKGWTEYSADVWKIDLGSPRTHDGYTATTDANIGYLVVDGVIKPVLKFAISDLSALWDFYCDVPNNALYVKASGNPTTLAADIRAAPNGNAHGGTGRIISCPLGSNNIHDVHVTGTGGCGIGGEGPDVHIHDCLIDYIGGSWLAGHADGLTRYGNGIDNWVNVKRWLIESNEIAQVYDVAWSPQGDAATSGSWEDMTFRNNHIHDCTQSLEFWSTGTSSAGGFKRILVEENLFERAGYSVFSDVRPNQNVRVHLLTYLWETPAEITIQNNIFDDAHGAYSYHAYEPFGLVTRNNTIRLRAGRKMQYQLPETVEQAAAWQAATGRELGSTITVLP